jgi:hypothetical protein
MGCELQAQFIEPVSFQHDLFHRRSKLRVSLKEAGGGILEGLGGHEWD